MRSHKFLLGAVTAVACGLLVAACGGGGDDNNNGGGGGGDNGFVVTHLVADTAGTLAKYAGENTAAANVDANLKNPWGLTFNPATGFAWLANNHTDTSTVYNSGGQNQLTVTLPPGMGPTGIVSSGGAGFNGALFILAGEDGTLAAWSTGTQAQKVFTATDGASYKGLAIAGNKLYAADFHNGKVDVFDTSFAKQAAGGFTDPNLPERFAPFGIQAIGNSIFVAYAQREEDGDDETAGAGLGIVDRFDLNGGAMTRIISNGNASPLNAPWGLVQAPANFGEFSGDLLVGNFGDGKIHAFDPSNGNLVGTVKDANGTDIAIEGLWGLAFGTGGPQPTNTLYFAAGINDEANGLYGRIDCNGGC